ncbi:hypothetical protein HV824_05475 [Myxococcus sp. AM009]|uniref:hypothetical protein n=1 Tax=unclassified Myxococcus TaxID=2648731 RepID=UPI0015959F1C|nr:MULTISPECIES: hypothetical protein [unclassified Myxococcus]NVI97567.1 hypothetical protein [Myxococcus sp. AM009]NVJ15483.1 hypothetical protein [Myxococcus sp. AM010]
MKHLDDGALSALSRREPEAVAYFAGHLAHPCETCEAFLATHPGPGLLDGHVDALLLGLAPPGASAPPLDEVGLARVRRALRAHRPAAGRWGMVAGGLAACLLAVVLLPRMRAEAPSSQGGTAAEWTGEKGRLARIALELSVVARDSEGGLRRLDPGSPVKDSEVLLLRYHATEAGTALLFEQRQGEAPALLGRFPLVAGTHDLQGPQGLAGVSLAGETGPVTLWLVGSAGSPPEAAAVGEMLEGRRGAGSQDPLAIIRFDVSVRSSQNRP